jgi:hypothetical protein
MIMAVFFFNFSVVKNISAKKMLTLIISKTVARKDVFGGEEDESEDHELILNRVCRPCMR